MAVAGSFYYSTFLGLHIQLFILAVTGVLGAAFYSVVTNRVLRHSQEHRKKSVTLARMLEKESDSTDHNFTNTAFKVSP